MCYVVSSVYSYLHCHMFNAVICGKDTKKFSNNKRFYSNFNFVKLCHDLANQASMFFDLKVRSVALHWRSLLHRLSHYLI